MQSSIEEITPIIGTSMGGGFYAGRIRIGTQAFALVIAPKDVGEHEDIAWHDSYSEIEGAKSCCDGVANTKAMAEAGSALAKWALSLTIDGNSDWYIPSQDELEIIYRNLKPTTETNSRYARSGINVSALVPTYPYTSDFPKQTQAEVFQAGGAEAFDDVWHWSSTQHAGNSGYAWRQVFSHGRQYNSHKDSCLRARAVRRLPI